MSVRKTSVEINEDLLTAVQRVLSTATLKDTIEQAFREVLRAQARREEVEARGRHRIPIPDLIIAAAAESSGLTLLHYDHDYDLIGEITGQPTEWVVERGTV